MTLQQPWRLGPHRCWRPDGHLQLRLRHDHGPLALGHGLPVLHTYEGIALTEGKSALQAGAHRLQGVEALQ